VKTKTPLSSASDRQQLIQRPETLPPVLPAPGGDGPAKSDRAPNPNETWEAWSKTGEQRDFHKVMTSLEPTIHKGLRAYGGDQRHLLTRARILAAGAVKSYDPKKAGEGRGRGKASLGTYVYSHLQRLQRVAADRREAVRVPERSRMDAIMLRSAVNEHKDRHGHEPDMATLGDATGLSRKRIQLAAHAFREISATGLETEKGDTLLQVDDKPEDDVWRDYVYFDLDPKSRKIFEWTTGYGGSAMIQKKEMARRLGMSGASVSGRIDTILKRLESRPVRKAMR